MANATFDIIGVLKRELKSYNVPAATLAVVAGIGGSRLSSYLNGTSRCPAEHDLLLRNSWSRLKKLIAFAKPLVLDFRRADVLCDCLDLMESGELQIIVYQNESVAPVQQ